MKWRPVCCVILLVCLILQAAPVMAATGATGVSGTVPLVTYDVSASDIGYFRATISWKTNDNATSQVFYDTKFHEDIADYAYHTSEDTTLVSEHSVTLTRLRPRTIYHFRVRSAIPVTEFVAISDEYSFTTLSPPIVVIPPVPPAPPPVPPGPPPGIAPVSEIVATNGMFTKGVVAESLSTGLAGSFTVNGKRVIPEVPPVIPGYIAWSLIGGIIASVIVAGLVVFPTEGKGCLRRRALKKVDDPAKLGCLYQRKAELLPV